MSRVKRRLRLRVPLLLLLVVLGASFILGGSARSDLATLVLLRPIAVLALGLALAGLRGADVRANRFILVMALLIVALPLVQLVPLPPAIWQALPGRELIVGSDQLAGVGPVWRPISLVPEGTWNAVFALSVPMAVLVAGIRLDGGTEKEHGRSEGVRDELGQLVPIILVIALLSAFLGLLQVVLPGSHLYPYTHSDIGSAVGFLANRNHQAALIGTSFPMLAVVASGDRRRGRSALTGWVALMIGIALIPLLLITGSRAGLVVGCVGMLIALFLYDVPRSAGRLLVPSIAGAIVLALVLAVLTISLGRAEALERVLQFSAKNDFRFHAWRYVAQLGWSYFPIGGGFGSFVAAFKTIEPYQLLNFSYFNQGHNDWLETVMNGGVAGLALLTIAVVAWFRRAATLLSSRRHWTMRDRRAALGLSVILLLAIASITDYPLRTPALASLFVVAVLWAAPRKEALASHRNMPYAASAARDQDTEILHPPAQME